MLHPEAAVIKEFIKFLSTQNKNFISSDVNNNRTYFELDSVHIESFLNSRQGIEFTDVLIVRESTEKLFNIL